MDTVASIRNQLIQIYKLDTSAPMVEIRGASFLADYNCILRPPNKDYITREIQWYQSQSLNVNDIEGETPRIWKQVASDAGEINSNYGYLFYGQENHSQFVKVVKELSENPASRRATAIYTRPTMHEDSQRDGMQDFVCTNAVQYAVNQYSGAVDVVVQMRSNDAVFGYNNDYAWQRFALKDVCAMLNRRPGTMIWQAASLHVYPRHYSILEALAR